MAHGPGLHYCYGIIAAELVESNGLETTSRALIGGAGSVSTGLMLLGAPLSAFAQDAAGAWRTVAGGAGVAALGLGLSGVATRAWHLYLTFGVLVGLGHSFCFPPCPVAVAQHFEGHPRAALASGIATAGSGFGTIALGLLTAWLVATGWRLAFFVLALSTFAFVELVAPALEARRRAVDRDAPRGVRRLVACTALYAFGWEIPFVHLVSYARERGHTPAAAAGAVVAIGVGGLGAAATALADAALPSIVASRVGLYCYGMLVGSTAGACVGLTTPLARACLEGGSLARASGLAYSAMAPGLLVGPIVAGALRDARSDGYDVAFYLAATCWAAATVAAWHLRASLRSPPPRALPTSGGRGIDNDSHSA
ncbi:hypothetical protein CTAYLR_005910 [Chrysophaeum taylorii]|uniref:Major facilitator superfamily (MFS) profile domain-containing protein n=1 Tax=Chrysophaeum taylorii TaxID=2483200 RepID=A0AAD7UI72_9STRA|nr:hypothetical protein CTAYLR_005884 [Chrysophaeum taylorii]KAJ8614332.1 hypothetical protein CTAYLR_005910 [Chrysophaeum taylorii]